MSCEVSSSCFAAVSVCHSSQTESFAIFIEHIIYCINTNKPVVKQLKTITDVCKMIKYTEITDEKNHFRAPGQYPLCKSVNHNSGSDEYIPRDSESDNIRICASLVSSFRIFFLFFCFLRANCVYHGIRETPGA